MPRYFFHIHDGLGLADTEGVVLPNARIARRTAIRVAADCLREHFNDGRLGGDWSMNVADESGNAICAMRFNASTDWVGT